MIENEKLSYNEIIFYSRFLLRIILNFVWIG